MSREGDRLAVMVPIMDRVREIADSDQARAMMKYLNIRGEDVAGNHRDSATPETDAAFRAEAIAQAALMRAYGKYAERNVIDLDCEVIEAIDTIANMLVAMMDAKR